ncbi:MAG TPA: plastocyanin/azurin family copper-binding protein [Cyclobacteriaceae bacterium]|nr:plastocyanin/azurin family copper-binding protein [Cyclobacteriaceae bacterium]
MMKRSLMLCAAVGVLLSCQQVSERKALSQQEPLQGAMFGSFMEVSPTQQEKPKYILMEVVPDLMKFSLDTFTVQAGQKVILELDNLDGMQHNLLIGKPGTLNKIGAAADAMLSDPKASEKHYVPQIPEVLFSTPLVDPGDVYSLEFTAPKEPGKYPFVCTFPGHWRMMSGIMIVEKK